MNGCAVRFVLTGYGVFELTFRDAVEIRDHIGDIVLFCKAAVDAGDILKDVQSHVRNIGLPVKVVVAAGNEKVVFTLAGHGASLALLLAGRSP